MMQILRTARARTAMGSALLRHGARSKQPLLLRQTYATTSILLEEEAVSKKSDAVEKAALLLRNKMAARDYNDRRAAYKREVTDLRRDYAKEVAQQRAADKAEQEALERELTRRRLERQRRKNIRSAQNAMRQKELREQREEEFNEHLQQMQHRRDAKNKRYAAARKLIVDELEKVAHLWLTTHEEVEAAFTPEAEQLLWARPAGILGEPNPSLDAHFWQNETHTWHMDRTYKSQREVLLEQVEELAYNDANIDKTFWTEERCAEQEQLEQKARLRAMVLSAGKIELLRKQKQMLEELLTTDEGEVPQPEPVPSNTMLGDEQAQEREGARLLLENPTKFFIFDDSSTIDQSASETAKSEDGESEFSTYSGPTLGTPVGLRDHLREGSHSVFPEVIGKITNPDMRTEREKRQQEREERMFAAAQAEAHIGDMDIELAAEQQTAEDLEPDLDYDDNEWDSDEEDWKQGVDPETESGILNTPRERRYKEEDIDWVIETLDDQVKHFEQQLKQDIDSLKQSVKSEILDYQGDGEEVVETDALHEALLSLSEEQLILLSNLDDQYEEMSADELSKSIEGIGLTEEQVRFILDRDRSE
jgi:hypothetical protein